MVFELQLRLWKGRLLSQGKAARQGGGWQGWESPLHSHTLTPNLPFPILADLAQESSCLLSAALESQMWPGEAGAVRGGPRT